MGSVHPHTIMALCRSIITVDGVTFVMTAITVPQKLMSFVINWDTLELQATLELEEQAMGLILIK